LKFANVCTADWLQATLSMSFRSEEVCRRIIRKKLHTDIFGYLNWDTLSAKTVNGPASEDKAEFVDKLLGILHKVVRRMEKARTLCVQPNAVEILQKFRAVTKFPVGYLHTVVQWTKCSRNVA